MRSERGQTLAIQVVEAALSSVLRLTISGNGIGIRFAKFFIFPFIPAGAGMESTPDYIPSLGSSCDIPESLARHIAKIKQTELYTYAFDTHAAGTLPSS
ncbi:MAG: hypothetical protein H0X25_19075 [Acidobacteriales bacterium]|nr:hypothetical protein [Terriglobales bacterium]